MDRNPETRTPNPAVRGTLDDTGHDRGELAHLDDLDDFKVADGEPDIRGWKVKSSDGLRIGKVEDLLVDTDRLLVRYLEVKLDKRLARADAQRHVLVPIGTARLDVDRDEVLLARTRADVLAGPRYEHGRLDREHEHAVLGGTGTDTGAAPRDRDDTAFYGRPEFDDRQFFGGRRAGSEGTTYVTRAEEELRIGKRAVEAGSVNVRKRVETEHVRETVPVMREEVTVDRRPVRADRAPGRAEIGDDEIRVPVMAEEVVTEKRAVPKEEVVIRKEAVRDERTVEADVRRERVDVDRTGDDQRRGRETR